MLTWRGWRCWDIPKDPHKVELRPSHSYRGGIIIGIMDRAAAVERDQSSAETEHFAGKFWVLAQSMALCARRSHCRSLSRARNHFTDPGPKFGMLTNSSSVVSRRSPIVFSPANFTAFRIRVGKRTISTRVSFGRSGPRSNILQPTHLAFSPARFAIAALHGGDFFYVNPARVRAGDWISPCGQPQFMQRKLIAVKTSNAAANQLSFSSNGGSRNSLLASVCLACCVGWRDCFMAAPTPK